MVIELLVERRQGQIHREKRAECERFEILLASREDGSIGTSAASLLDEHLRTCADCTAVAGTMPPIDHPPVAGALPAVSTSAYALGREVARGGMGRILAAQDLRIGRPVAVKELLGKSPSLAARFEREARVTARLQHPGIVPIYEIGRWPDGTPFYAMRMVEGRTLREAIRDKETLDGRLELLPAVIAAVDAVAFAHDKWIIHRDLTPNNILVGAYGDTVVIDWGLAKDLSHADDDEVAAGPYRDESTVEGLTNAGAVIGTAAYMPPEQARGEPVDERADVYALGAILYHLLASEAPYRASKSDDVLRQLHAAPPRSIGDVAPGAPRDLISIVDKAMSRDPAGRYANVGELAAELRRFQTGRVVEAHHYTRPERIRRWVRNHRALVIGSSAALAALVITGAFGIAGIVRERNRAETGERDAVRQRTAAEQTNADLLEEQGRQQLLAGNSVQSAVWLSAAYSAGNRRPSLRFLLATAMRDIETLERKFDCEDEVRHIDVSPDKSLLLAVCSHSLKQWRLEDGALIATLTVPNAEFSGARYSHDGRIILTWGPDRIARVWDPVSGALRQSLEGHTDKISNSAFSADDRRILTSSFDRTIRVWDAVDGSLLRTIQAAAEPQVGVRGTFIGGDRIVSASTDGVMKVWDFDSGTLLRTISNGTQIIGGDLEVGASGNVVAVCGADSVAKLWNLETGVLVGSFSGHTDMVLSCILSLDRRLLVTTSSDGTAKVWSVDSKRVVRSVEHGGVVHVGVLTASGQTLVTGGMPGIKVWDVATGTLLGADDSAIAEPDRMLVVGDRIVAGADSTLRVWRHLGERRARAFRAPQGTKLAGLSGDASRAAIDDHGAITIWNTDTNQALAHQPLSSPISYTGARLAAKSAAGVAIIDWSTGRTVATRPVEKDLVDFTLGNGGRHLLTAGKDRTAMWDVARGMEIAHWDSTWRVVGLERGEWVVLEKRSSDDSRIEVWSLDPPQRLQRLDSGSKSVDAWFDRSGTRMAIRSDGFPGELTIWDVTTGRKLKTFSGVLGAKPDPTRALVVVTGMDVIQVVRIADATSVAAVAAAWTLGGADLTRDATFIGGAQMLEGTVDLWDTRGRILTTLRFARDLALGRDKVEMRGRQAEFYADGTRLLSKGEAEFLSLSVEQEQRDPDVVARIVRARSPWILQDGHLSMAPDDLLPKN